MKKSMIRLALSLMLAAGVMTAGAVRADEPAVQGAQGDRGVEVTPLIHTTHSWDGGAYTHYPPGVPLVDVQRVYIPAHTVLPWHSHAVVNAVYLLSGSLTVEKKNGEGRTTFKAGQVIADAVDTVHHGFTTDEPAEMIVFFAGVEGLPLRTLEKN
jgi:quercetin dioxygenase-like cupin family protein